MSNEELKAVVQEAIQADLFDSSFKCKDEDRDFCLFDCCTPCKCVGSKNAPSWCPEREKIPAEILRSEEHHHDDELEGQERFVF